LESAKLSEIKYAVPGEFWKKPAEDPVLFPKPCFSFAPGAGRIGIDLQTLAMHTAVLMSMGR
jgi:hypothetical protein